MGCSDYPRPERDVPYDRIQGLVGQLTSAGSYGRELLREYERRGAEIKRLRAVADAAEALVERIEETNAEEVYAEIAAQVDDLLAGLLRALVRELDAGKVERDPHLCQHDQPAAACRLCAGIRERQPLDLSKLRDQR